MKPLVRPRSVLLAGAALLSLISAQATVAVPCDKGPKHLANFLAESTYVFVARIKSVSWYDPQEGAKTTIEYPVGSISAAFHVVATVKGDPSRLSMLRQTLFGNPSSHLQLQVTRTYLIFTNDGTIGYGGCTNHALPLSIEYTNDYRSLVLRLQSPEPDDGPPLFTSP